jgi:hypothetical protein
MFSNQPFTTGKTAPASQGLPVHLWEVNAALASLRLQMERVQASPELSGLGFNPRQVAKLCAILDQGRGSILRRIADSGDAVTAEKQEAGLSQPADDPANFLPGYRAGCRRLCRALRDALRVSDGSAGATLSELVLRLEKQLWLIDTPSHYRGIDACRSVSLFLTC